jgi:hypothetical protein
LKWIVTPLLFHVLELREKLWENPVLHVGDDLDVPVWHGRQVCCTSSGTTGTRARARGRGDGYGGECQSEYVIQQYNIQLGSEKRAWATMAWATRKGEMVRKRRRKADKTTQAQRRRNGYDDDEARQQEKTI